MADVEEHFHSERLSSHQERDASWDYSDYTEFLTQGSNASLPLSCSDIQTFILFFF